MKVLKSEELRGKYHCRLMKNLKKEIEVTTKKNDNYDNAIIIKQIIMGYLKGEFQINEFHDLVSEGVEENNLPAETNEGRIKRLTEILTQFILDLMLFLLIKMKLKQSSFLLQSPW